MKKTLVFTIVTTLFALGLAACSGDDDGADGGGTPEIRTEKGLAVALAADAGSMARERSVGSASDAEDAYNPPNSGDQNSASDTDTGLDTAKEALRQAQAAGLTVTGYGLATADADSAIIEFYFSSNYYQRPATGSSGGGTSSSDGQETPSTPGIAATPITESDLKAVIDTVIAAGVSEGDIEFIGGSYYDPYYASATLRVTLRDIGNVGTVIDAATSAASGLTNIYLQGTYVSYTLEDCAALQEAALQAAVEDAATQGDALASALDVTRGAIVAASTYSYSAYGGTSCNVGGISPYPLGGIAYTEGQASQVQVYATVTVTYAMD